MLPTHLAPGLLLVFMFALAILPLAFVWWDGRLRERRLERLAALRSDVRLREHLAHRAGGEVVARSPVMPRA